MSHCGIIGQSSSTYLVFTKSKWGQIPTIPICSVGLALHLDNKLLAIKAIS